MEEELLNFKKEVVKIIAEYFGQDMANLYEKFYFNKPKETILISIEELLQEHIGETKAEEQLEKLRKITN